MPTAKKLACIAIFMTMLAPQTVTAERSGKAIIIAHRGASGYRPEHTLAAYELAINMGADFIEPDLVPTKDGVLVARHENEISSTTDVANHKEFANRRVKKEIDGQSLEGWFTEDFTLAELKTLRAKERMPNLRQHNTIYNEHYSVPTFQEILELVKKKNAEFHKQIGIYPELKHPTYFSGLGLSTEKPLLDALSAFGYTQKTSPVFIQCFEPSTLKSLHKKTRLSLVLLIETEARPYDLVIAKDPLSYAEMLKPAGLADIAKYAQGVGPDKNLIVPRDSQGALGRPTSLVVDAHKAGLLVHAWTFRNENSFLPLDYRNRSSGDPPSYGDAFSEYKLFYELGVDGVFSENPDTALEARDGKHRM